MSVMITHDTRDDLYTVAEAAALLRVSKPTIWRWIRSGCLPARRMGERIVRIRRAELDALTEGRKQRGGPEPWWAKYIISTGDPSVSEEEWLRRVHEINEQILEDRGGVPIDDDSLPYIHEARREREAQL